MAAAELFHVDNSTTNPHDVAVKCGYATRTARPTPWSCRWRHARQALLGRERALLQRILAGNDGALPGLTGLSCRRLGGLEHVPGEACSAMAAPADVDAHARATAPRATVMVRHRHDGDLQSLFKASTTPLLKAVGSLLRAAYMEPPQFAPPQQPPQPAAGASAAPPPPYGPGLDISGDRECDWRAAFPRGTFGRLSALQVLEECRDALYVRGYPLSLRLDDAAEGLRRTLALSWKGGLPPTVGRGGAGGERAGLHTCPASAAQVSLWARVLVAEARDEAAGRPYVRRTVADAAGVEEAAGAVRSSPRPVVTFTELAREKGGMPLPMRVAMTASAMLGRSALAAVGMHLTRVRTKDGCFFAYDSDPPQPGGPPARRPVVVVHGMFTTAQSMIPLALLLVRAGHRVVLPDLLQFDFGFSRAKGGRFLSWTGHAEAVAGFVRQLAIDSQGAAPRVDLCGHSYGGWICQRIASRHPHLVRRVVLVAPGGCCRYRVLNSTKALFGGRRATAEIFALHMPWPVAWLVAGAFQALYRSAQNVAHIESLEFSEYQGFAGDVFAPTLVLWGTHDDLHQAWGSDHSHVAPGRAFARRHERPPMLEQLHCAKGFWLEGCGHAVNVDGARTVARLAHALFTGGLEAVVDAATPDRWQVDAALMDADADVRPPPSTRLRAACAVAAAALWFTDAPLKEMPSWQPSEAGATGRDGEPEVAPPPSSEARAAAEARAAVKARAAAEVRARGGRIGVAPAARL